MPDSSKVGIDHSTAVPIDLYYGLLMEKEQRFGQHYLYRDAHRGTPTLRLSGDRSPSSRQHFAERRLCMESNIDADPQSPSTSKAKSSTRARRLGSSSFIDGERRRNASYLAKAPHKSSTDEIIEGNRKIVAKVIVSLASVFPGLPQRRRKQWGNNVGIGMLPSRRLRQQSCRDSLMMGRQRRVKKCRRED
mmetsp:Transcript_21301/g.34306  ORF Transcript_21301/g.34306 Transcript_21301/m.34306 type:complete len:191 (-) Transcript_21301:189-761(-)